MVIDKNLLSKKSGQESADELFGPLKAKLVKARGEFENFVADNQSELIESIDNCVKEVVHSNNHIANVNDSITFEVEFDNRLYGFVKGSKSIDFDTNVSGRGIDYVFKNIYRYEVDKSLVDMDALSFSEFSQLQTNCEKYLANSINLKKIEINDETNTIKVFSSPREYLIKAANDFSRFVVAYLAKQGIKSRARQTDNKVTVVIERDTDTGGFEEI